MAVLIEPASALTAVLALRVGTLAATVSVFRRPRAARTIAFVGTAVASLMTGLAAAEVLRTAAPVHGVLLQHHASGFSLVWALDGLSAWFLVVLSALAIPIAIFSIGYTGHPHFRRRSAFIGAMFNVVVGTVEVVLLAGDAVTFLFAWEAMTLSAAALVTTDHEVRESRRAAYLYLVMSHVATGCLIAGFLLLAGASGATSFAALLGGTVVTGPVRDVLFALFFVGFGLKAGVIPLHIWLPEAHPVAPTNISAFMSGVLIKSGIYGIFRVCAFGLGVPRLSWGVIVVLVGGLSAVLGVLYALMQHDLKRLLAYHSIENIGIILLGLGAGMVALASGRTDIAALGIAASLYHVLNHAMFKGLLFLGAGGVVLATGTRQIERLGGLLKRMPWTGLSFLVGAVAISGLPPLNGFVSEWLTFQAFLFGSFGSSSALVHFLFPVGGTLLALTSALAAACFVKAFGISFLALPRSPEAAAAEESPAVMLVPQLFLAAVCIGLGLFPGAVLRTIGGVSSSLAGVAPAADLASSGVGLISGTASGTFDHLVPLVFVAAISLVLLAVVVGAVARRVAVRRVPTWGCGGELTPQTEYTATAFSKPLMMIFGAIYRPTREVHASAAVSPYFPSQVHYHAEIEPTFERYVYGPLVRTVMRVAHGLKVLQAGSLHAYLAYVMVLVVSLVLLIWWRN